MAGYDYTKPNPLVPGVMGIVDFPETQGYSRNLYDTQWNNWTPHVGFAYQLAHNLVARGGFAIDYLPSNTGYYSSPNDLGEATWTTGNTGAQTYGASPNGVPTEDITDTAPLVAATGSNPLAPQTYGVGEAYFPRNLPNQCRTSSISRWRPPSEQVAMALLHGICRFPSKSSLHPQPQFRKYSKPLCQRSGYACSLAVDLDRQQRRNAAANRKRYQSVPAGGACPLAEIPKQPGELHDPTIHPVSAYPLLYGGQEDGARGFGSYDSLQTHFAHRTSALYLDANFTWSKNLGFANSIVGGGNISALDLLCNRCNRNYFPQDTPFRVVVTAIYQSPFSQGQMWAGSDRVVRAILGGWSISPVFLYQDGNPVTLTGGSGQFTSRVNYTVAKGAVNLRLPSSYTQSRFMNSTTKVTLPCGIIVTPGLFNKMKYNPCAFNGPTVTTPNGNILADEYWYGNGNQTNGNIRGPLRINVDTSVRRTFNLTERFKLDITAAVTNVMNTAEWSSSPSGGAGGTDTVDNRANGQIVGLVTGGGYGQWGTGTYDPRQIELIGRIVF